MTTNTTNETRGTVTEYRDPDAWDRFVTGADGPPFALSGWGRACETYGHEWLPLAATDGAGVRAVLPLVHMESRLFGSKLVSPPFGERGGVIAHESTPEAAIRALVDRTVELARERAVDFVSLRGPGVGRVDPLTEKRRFVTFRVPVGEGVESTWEGIKESRRRQIRQARDDPELAYDTGETLADLREYYDLYLRSVRGHGTPPHSFDFFRTLWEDLHGSGHMYLGFVRKDGVPINGMIDLQAGTTVHQWGVVNDYEYRDRNGGSYLLWKSLERAAQRGYGTYEFGRTREGSGVYMFKKSFGGSKTWYDDHHYFPGEGAELPHPEDETYEPAKRVWKRLPIPVTELVGPRLRRGISL